MNDLVDLVAKQGARLHPRPERFDQAVRLADARVREVARFVAVVAKTAVVRSERLSKIGSRCSSQRQQFMRRSRSQRQSSEDSRKVIVRSACASRLEEGSTS